MHQTLFEIPIFRYQVSDWKNKKKEVYSWINKTELIRKSNMTFLTDRGPLGSEVGQPRLPKQDRFYKEDFCNLFESEFKAFLQESEMREVGVIDVWTVEYHFGDYQVPHNHRSVGFSGILYVNFDPREHTATQVMQPWNDPVTDAASFLDLMPEEGTMVFFPSLLLHFVNPNFSRTRRTTIAFDIEVR